MAKTQALREVKPGFDPGAATQLPTPCGYRILIALQKVEEKTEGGIIKPGQTQADERVLGVKGFVLKMGSDCYTDKEKFPTGPWCKEGDWVLFRKLSGSRFKIYGNEFRIINDDTVECVIDDPRGIEAV